jgi:hypothetical protein
MFHERSTGDIATFHRSTREDDMQVDKDQVIQLLKSQGQHDKAAEAESELPDQVDTDNHSGLLSKFGVDPQELVGGLAGSDIGKKFGL